MVCEVNEMIVGTGTRSLLTISIVLKRIEEGIWAKEDGVRFLVEGEIPEAISERILKMKSEDVLKQSIQGRQYELEIPEPNSWILLPIGILGLVLLLAKRK